MYSLKLFCTAAFLALLAVVCSLPAAAQSVQEYDEQQERLHKMLDMYERKTERRSEGDYYHDDADMSPYEEAMQMARQRNEQDRIKVYNKEVFEHAHAQHQSRQHEFEERLALMRVHKLAEDEERKKKHAREILKKEMLMQMF